MAWAFPSDLDISKNNNIWPTFIQFMSDTILSPQKQITDVQMQHTFLENWPRRQYLHSNYSRTLSYSESTLIKVSKARMLSGLVHKKLRTLESKLLMLKPVVSPILDCCSVVCFNMQYSDWFEIGSAYWTFATGLLNDSALANYMECRGLIHLYYTWPRRL